MSGDHTHTDIPIKPRTFDPDINGRPLAPYGPCPEDGELIVVREDYGKPARLALVSIDRPAGRLVVLEYLT